MSYCGVFSPNVLLLNEHHNDLVLEGILEEVRLLGEQLMHMLMPTVEY